MTSTVNPSKPVSILKKPPSGFTQPVAVVPGLPAKSSPGFTQPVAAVPVHPTNLYPYQKPMPFPTNYPPRRRRRTECCRCRRCCCCFLFLVLIVLVLLAGAGGVFYLLFRPQLPVFVLESVRTPRFNITLTPTGTVLDAQTVAVVRARNPNGKIAVSYAPIQAHISAGDDVDLGSGDFPGFEQSSGNSTMMRFVGLVKGAIIDDGLGSSLKARYRNKDINVHVEVRTRLGIRLGGWHVGRFGIRFRCAGVVKKLEGGGKSKCRIDLLKWIDLNF